MSDSEEDVAVERQVKISLVGEPSTGKSMLCSRYLDLQWTGAAAPTQGAEILLGECPVRPSEPLIPIKFCDVAGNACNTTMLANYLYASDVILFVYDVTNLHSFERLSTWYTIVSDMFSGSEEPPVMAVFGNKCDLEHQRAVRLSSIQHFTEDNDLIGFIGSARTGENVHSTFISLVSEALGLPVNRSLFNNSVIKAELAPQVKFKAERRKSENNSQNSHETEMNKKNTENTKAAEEKSKVKKSNKKTFKELKKKASSAVCSLQ